MHRRKILHMIELGHTVSYPWKADLCFPPALCNNPLAMIDGASRVACAFVWARSQQS